MTIALTAGLLREALSATVDGVVITEAGNQQDRRIVYVNSAFETMTGYEASDIVGKDCRFLNKDARDEPALETVRQSLQAGKPCRVVLLNHRSDGTPFWNELSLSPVADADGQVTHFIGIQKDVSERVRQENALRQQQEQLAETVRKLEELSTRDPLTGLHNRRYFQQNVGRAWATHRRQGSELAIAFMDIDRFKAFNDRYGHVSGDSLLCAIADQISRFFCRASDITARYGGEEFVLASSIDQGHGPFVERLRAMQSAIADLGITDSGSGGTLVATISIGVCHGVPRADADVEAFIERADKAMYEAKGRGGNEMVVAKFP